eukprot:7384040-Prymnesium_polylepis.2
MPVWWFEHYRYVPAKGGPGTRAPVWRHVRDAVLMLALSNVRAALGVSEEAIGPIVKKETRIDGGASLKALVGWELTYGVPNHPSSGAAEKQAVAAMMAEELVIPADSLGMSIELVHAAIPHMSLTADSLTPPRSAAPQVYSDAPSADADADRCPPYETSSEVDEPDY